MRGSILLTLLSNASVINYYVDATGGSDSNNGLSPAAAWKTLAKVSGFSFTGAATINLKCGEKWREQLTVPASSLTFTSYGSGANPVISGADAYTWTQVSGNVWRHDQAPAYITTRQVIFDGVRGTVKGSQAALTTDGDWWYDGSTTGWLFIYSSTNPNSRAVDVSIRNYCIVINNKSNLSFNNITVEKTNTDFTAYTDLYAAIKGTFSANATNISFNNVACNYNYGSGIHLRTSGSAILNGVTLNSVTLDHNFSFSDLNLCGVWMGGAGGAISNLTMNNCRVSYTGREGASIISQHGVNLNNVSNGTINNLITEYNGSDGINIENGSANITLTGGRTHHNGGSAGGDNAGVGVGSFGNGSSNIIFQGMEMDNNYTDGIQISPTDTAQLSTGVILRYCSMHHNTRYGIEISSGGGVSIYYNLIYSNTLRGLSIGTSALTGTFPIYNNTFYGNADRNVSFGTTAVTFKNNLLAEAGTLEIVVGSQSATAAVTMPTADYNLYYHSAGGSFMNKSDAGGSNSFSGGFAGWKAASTWDVHSINSNPLFTNAAGNNFTLQVGSPAKNAGVDVGLTRDYAGNVVSGSPSIGAYQ